MRRSNAKEKDTLSSPPAQSVLLGGIETAQAIEANHVGTLQVLMLDDVGCNGDRWFYEY